MASAEVSAWHMAADRNQPMQWSSNYQLQHAGQMVARTHQCGPRDAADCEPSYLMVVLSVTPLAEHLRPVSLRRRRKYIKTTNLALLYIILKRLRLKNTSYYIIDIEISYFSIIIT